MEKRKLKILVINRSLKQGEHPVKDIFQHYKGKYDVIIFPWREDKKKTEVIFFDVYLIEQFEEIFSVSIELDAPGFFDFDQEDVTEDTFYDMLDQEFEIDNFNLTDIEEFGERPVDTIRKMNPGSSIPTGRELAKMLKNMSGGQE